MPDPTHQACLDAAKSILAGLNLAGITVNVIEELQDDEANVALPALLVRVSGEAETIRPLTTASRLVGYPVRVELVDAAAGPGTERLPGWLQWRDAILSAFQDRRQPNYPDGVHGCEEVPGAVASDDERAQGRVRGTLVLRFRAVRPVGV